MELNKKFRFKSLKGRKKSKDGRKPLLSNMMVQNPGATDEIHLLSTGEKILKNPEKINPDLISTEAAINGDKVLNYLRKILSVHSDPQDLNSAAVVVNTWSTLNGVTADKKEDSYPQIWLCEFLQELDRSVESQFPILPVEGAQSSEKLVEFLRSAENMMCSEVHRLTPVLKDAELLGYLIDSYSHQLFAKLNLLLKKDLSMNEVFCLLQWGKHVFFSPNSQIVFRMCDPLMLSGWFERAKQKLLSQLKKEISKALQNILCYEKKHEDNEKLMNEEWFIRVHIDVAQCLLGAIQNAKKCSPTLLQMVQKLCTEELDSFVQKYVQAERKCLDNLHPLKTNFLYLCRIISTCIQLRRLAVKISENRSNDTVCILRSLEDHVSSIVQKMMKDLAQERLKKYFEEDMPIYDLTDKIQMQFSSLPQTETTEEIKPIIVNLAYDCVSHVYLNCLLKNKFKRLERRWGNVEERIRQDVQMIQDTFNQLNCYDNKNQLLGRMSEVLFYHDKETLKITSSNLFQDFPEDSELYLPRLLHWKKMLSKPQVRDVLDVGRLGHPNSACDNSRSQPSLCCLFC